jgi:hypothetical protein
VNEIIQTLGHVSDLWLNPSHPLHQETVEALQVSTGLNRRQIEMALNNCFLELTAPKITAYVASFALGKRSVMDVFHVLPSNAFTAWVHGATLTLVLGDRCLLKPSTREPIFARAWQKSLITVDPQWAERVEIVSWDVKRLQKCQAVIAYGSNETLEKIRTLLPKGVRFAGYGHKLSVGIIFEEALDPAASGVLLDDVRQAAEPFRMQGCLSPQILYIENGTRTRWPELEATLDAVPKIKSFTEWNNVAAELGTFTPYLSCVGYAGAPEREPFLIEALRPYTVSRVCPIRLMQRPPLTWQNGGIDLVNLLNSSRKGGPAYVR